jgi:hypothetical protein
LNPEINRNWKYISGCQIALLPCLACGQLERDVHEVHEVGEEEVTLLDCPFE